MRSRLLWTRLMAVVGILLVLFPVLFPLVGLIPRLVRRGMLNFDFLIPAELFMVVLAGGLLLVWAAIRARTQRAWIIASLGAAALLLILSMLFAVLTGAAYTVGEPPAWQKVLILTPIVLYDLAVIVTGAGGVLLMIKLFHKPAMPG